MLATLPPRIDVGHRSLPRHRILWWSVCFLLPALLPATEPGLTASVPVETLELENGLQLLLVERPEMTTVAAGWVVEVGSADEQPGRTGLSHLLEHLMFKGTRTIGSRDIDKELATLEREDRAQALLHELRTELSTAPPRQRAKLERRLVASEEQVRLLQEEARSQALLGEFSLLYSQLGAVGLNAHTLRDLTFYYVTLPTEKLEAWFWLESDRLLEPVFREFDKELAVLREERRLRIESDPTGLADEQLEKEFWSPHPYAWDPQGLPEDLDELSRESAYAYFRQHYVPQRITAALVGRFDRQQVRRLARLYFGRLPSRQAGVRTAVSTVPPEGPTEGAVLDLQCRCPSQIHVLYPSAAFGQADSRALEVLAAILNGRAGRLYRSLVLDRGIAFSASALQSQLRQAGTFVFQAETKGTSSPESLLAAWDLEVARLQAEPVAAEELLRAKNRLTAEAFRRLKDPASLLVQLLVYQGMGDWREINSWPREVLLVEPEQVQSVATRYLQPARRTIAFYRRTDGLERAAEPDPPPTEGEVIR